MKRPIIWTSVGMLSGLIIFRAVQFRFFLIIVCFILGCILLHYRKVLCILYFCGIFLACFSSFCYRSKLFKIQSDFKNSIYFEGKVKEAYQYGFLVRLDHYGNDNITHSARSLYSYYILVYSENIPMQGTTILIEGESEAFSHAENPGQFDSLEYYTSIGCICSIQTDTFQILNKPRPVKRCLNHIRNIISCNLQKIYPKDTVGICNALLLGDKSLMGEEQKELYERFGLAHILTVSGMHIGILANLILAFLLLFLPRKHAENTVILISLFYCALCMFSISSIRAVFTLIISFYAERWKRTYDSLSANLFVMLCILYFAPYRLTNISFQLSFSAGVLLSISNKSQRQWKGGFVNMLRTSVILQTGLLPIQLHSFYTFSPVGIFFNVLLLSFLELAFIFLIISLLFSFTSLLIGRFFAGLVHYIFLTFQKILKILGKCKFLSLTLGNPALYMIVIFVILYSVILYFDKKSKKPYFIILSFIWLVFLPLYRDTIVVNLSVGQGDCSVILNKSSVILIDCGSNSMENVGEKILLPFLQYYGYDHIDYVFISHLDSDHINGIKKDTGLFSNKTKYFIGEYFCNRDSLSDLITDNTQVTYTNGEDSIQIGEVSIQVLYYKENFQKDDNEHCQLLSAGIKGYRFLYLGDVSADILETLDERYIKDCYLVKIPHHGSRSSLSESFYTLVNPSISVVSVGRNNYGHPNKEVLDSLHKVSSRVFVTKEDGAVITSIKRKGIRSSSFISSK